MLSRSNLCLTNDQKGDQFGCQGQPRWPKLTKWKDNDLAIKQIELASPSKTRNNWNLREEPLL